MSLRLPWVLTPRIINNIPTNTTLSKTECKTRCALATAYRLTHFMGWDELIYGHITARIPGTQEFLINPFGQHYNEVTANDLIKIDIHGNVLSKGNSDFGFQQTGYIIHSAIHQHRPDLSALMHIHSRAGIAIATSVDKLLPICQHAVFIEPVSYHPYRGIVTEESEKAELAQNFQSPSKCLLLRNHGLLTGGVTIEEAFINMYFFHATCQAYIDCGYASRPVPPENVLSGELVERSVRASERVSGAPGLMVFRALARQLDDAGYKTGYTEYD